LLTGITDLRTDGMFTVAAINRGREDGFSEGRLIDIRRTLQSQEKVVGYARIVAAEQFTSYVVVQSPVSLILSKSDRFAISEAENDFSGFKFMSKNGHKGSFTFSSFLRDDDLLLTANSDEFIIWDWKSGRKIQARSNWHGVIFRSFAVNKRTNTLYVLTSSTLYEWDLNKMEVSKSTILHDYGSNPFIKIIASGDGNSIAHITGRDEVSLLDGALREVWRIGLDQTLGQLGVGTALSPDGRLLITSHVRLEERGPKGLVSPRSLVLWDTKLRKMVRKIAEQEHDFSIVRFVPSQDAIAYGADDGQLMFVSQAGKFLASKALGPNGIIGLEFSSDGKTFVTSDRVGEVRLWQYPSFQTKVISNDAKEWIGPEEAPLAFTSDGKHLTAQLKNNAIGVWEVSTGKLVRKFGSDGDEVIQVLPAKNFNQLVVVNKNRLETWDLSTGAMKVLEVPNLLFAALGAVSGRIISVSINEIKKYFSAMPGIFEPDTLKLSSWREGLGTDISLWGQREIEDYAITSDEKYLVKADVLNLSILDLGTGSIVESRTVVTDEEFQRFYGAEKEPKSHLSLVGKVQVSEDGRKIAYGRDDGLLRIWRLESGKIGKEVYAKKFAKLEAFAMSADFETVAASAGGGKVTVTAVSTDKLRYEVAKPGIDIDKIVFDPEGTKFAVVADFDNVHAYSLSDGLALYSKHLASRVVDVTFSPHGNFLYSGISGGQIYVFRAGTGQLVAQLVGQRASDSAPVGGDDDGSYLRRIVKQVACSFRCGPTGKGESDARWLTFTPDSRFDSNSLAGELAFSWVGADNPLRPIAPEIFMRDYYEPRLLPRLLACHGAEARGGDPEACKKAFKEVRPLAALNRIQPDVRIAKVERGASADEAVVTVEMAGKEEPGQKNGKTKTGVYDLRLFRDEQIVSQWPEPRGGMGGAEAPATWQNETLVPMPAGQTTATHQFRVKLAGGDKGQPIRFTAYAFNEDRVKSETATDESYRVPADIRARKPRAYVVTIGVNAYQNPQWKLGFAVKDAQDLTEALQRIEGYEVVPVPLVSSENGSKLATKVNIRDVIALLAGTGEARRAGLKDRIGPVVDQLHKVTPDDLVILAFSGHGHTDQQGRFYLLPSDSGPDSAITDARLPKFISSEELSQWLREVDAGELVMIIDACHSAASVPEGFKPGPMGDRGLGQLAYDKGMQILAATQADNVALESENLGQGLLTYALVQDGLKARKAAPDGKGPITIKAWLRYAEKRVPELYEDVRAGRLRVVGFDATDADRQLVAKDSSINPAFYTEAAQHAQTPALFDFYKLKNDPVLLRNAQLQ
jgi:WD40 repeat protein/uncharacterized caspase-like protein